MDHPKGHPLFGRLDFQAGQNQTKNQPKNPQKQTSFSSFPSIISLPFLPYKTTIQPFQPHQHLLGFNGFGWIFLFITSSLQELFTLGFQWEHRGFSQENEASKKIRVLRFLCLREIIIIIQRPAAHHNIHATDFSSTSWGLTRSLVLSCPHDS